MDYSTHNNRCCNEQLKKYYNTEVVPPSFLMLLEIINKLKHLKPNFKHFRVSAASKKSKGETCLHFFNFNFKVLAELVEY